MKWRTPKSLFCYKTSQLAETKCQFSGWVMLQTSVPVRLQNNSSTARAVFRLTENSGAKQRSRLCNDEQQHERQQAATSFGSNRNSAATLRKKQLIAATRKGVGRQPMGPGVMFRVNTSESGLRRVTSNVNSQGTCTSPPPRPIYHPLLIGDRKSIARIQLGES
jgi:hypothetical protein